VQNSKGFGMQQTERRRTDLPCSTNYNVQNKNQNKNNKSVAIGTHRKFQTEEVHPYKTDKKPIRRDAKQNRCQIAEAPNRRGAK